MDSHWLNYSCEYVSTFAQSGIPERESEASGDGASCVQPVWCPTVAGGRVVVAARSAMRVRMSHARRS